MQPVRYRLFNCTFILGSMDRRPPVVGDTERPPARSGWVDEVIGPVFQRMASLPTQDELPMLESLLLLAGKQRRCLCADARHAELGGCTTVDIGPGDVGVLAGEVLLAGWRFFSKWDPPEPLKPA